LIPSQKGLVRYFTTNAISNVIKNNVGTTNAISNVTKINVGTLKEFEDSDSSCEAERKENERKYKSFVLERTILRDQAKEPPGPSKLESIKPTTFVENDVEPLKTRARFSTPVIAQTEI
jgi:hypothetical protein